MNIDAIVSRGGAINSFGGIKNSKMNLTLQPLWETGLRGVVYNNEYLLKVPPPFLTWSFIRYYNDFKRRNFLIYPATVNSDQDKNQYGFARLVEASSIKDHTILFCGPIESEAYAVRTSKLLHKKGIKHLFLGPVPQGVLRFLYLLSKGLILYSRLDFSPRVIPEGLWAGLPFIVNDRVVLANDYRKFGWSCKDGSSEELNAALNKITNYQDHDKIHLYCKKNLTLIKNYKKIIGDINEEYKRCQA